MSADGERIAPVTYLFGAAAPAVPDKHDEPRSPSEQRFPAFVDLAANPPPTQPRADNDDDLGAERGKGQREPAIRRSKGSFDRVNNVSMFALARRGMSSHEMRDYLLSREFEADAVEAEIERLESVALLDDLALAETLVRTLRERKGLGKSALSAELRRRRLDPVAVETALGELDDDEVQRAIDLAVKRAPQLRSVDAETAKRRLGAFLMRRGYSGSAVSTAVQRALAPAGPTFR
jgi:SOS response regulatory protein OraA/RecX